jgi:hypothetical protein
MGFYDKSKSFRGLNSVNLSIAVSSILLVLLFSFCKNASKRRILVEDVYAEGDISKDSILNGLIRFYDTVHNRLVMVANYKNGVLDGKRTDYYKNGRPETEIKYENGKINGELIVYDTTGKITEKQNYYYDLVTGHSQSFINGKISNYAFYSLDNEILFTLDYDKPKKIEDINKNSYFFWNINNYKTTASQDQFSELFIYLPNPPKLNLRYSLCIIDKDYTVSKVVKEFNSSMYWEKTDLNYAGLKPTEMFALRLNIENAMDDPADIAVMFKKL